MYNIDWIALLPLLMVVGLGLATMLLGVFIKEDSPQTGYFALAGMVGTALYTAASWAQNPGRSVTMLDGRVTVDGFSMFFYVLFLVIGAVSVVMALPYLERENSQRGDFYALMFFALAGMFVMVMSNDLISLFLGFETMSLAIYALVGWRRRVVASNEAVLKYFFLGSFAAGIFLYGIALIYGTVGSTNLLDLRSFVLAGDVLGNPLFVIGTLLVFVGLAFKIATFPFHQWMPDVYEGAPSPVTAFMATAVKAAGFALVIRFFVSGMGVGDLAEVGSSVVWWLAVATMFAGNVFALAQKNIKRMLAYSSVAHTGYLLVAVIALPDVDAFASLLFYLVAYAFTNLGALACVSFLSAKDERLQNIEDFAGAAWRYPIVGVGMAICMFSLIGFPPTAGFFGKYYLFAAALKAGFAPLVVIAIINSILSVYYYLRVVVVMFMKPEQADMEPGKPALLTRVAVGYAAVAVIWAGVGTFNVTAFLPGAAPLLASAKASARALMAPAATSRPLFPVR